MSVLLLVRHGQTRGFLTDGYVDLTALGRAQSTALGVWLGQRGIVPDQVLVGPQPRHVQTHALAAAASGVAWPAPTTLPGLDEHHGLAVMTHAVTSGWIGEQAAHAGLEDAGEVTSRAMLRAFQHAMHAWVDGRLLAPGVEDWPAFRARVEVALDALTQAPSGSTILAVTSGGFVGAAVASVLGVPSEATALELAFAVGNTSVTEVRFDRGRRGLHAFNGTPHLGQGVLATAI